MSRIICAVLGLLVICAGVRAEEKVTLKRAPATVETKTFDPKKLPNPAPPIHPPEAACCVSDYQCNIELAYSTTEEGPVAGLGRATATITGIQATVGLKIVIWLPKGANAELKAHEEGHRVIAQRVYDKSDPALRKLLESYLGKTFQGRGADAVEKAANAAGSELSKACINLLGGESGRVNIIYDELTNHSLKKDPPADKAVEQAFERYAKEQAGK